jgi:hypothetical protein
MKVLIPRRKLAHLLASGLLAAGLGAWVILNNDPLRAYNSIRVGMTAAEVQAVLGPTSVPPYNSPLEARKWMSGHQSSTPLGAYQDCRFYVWVERGMVDWAITTVIVDGDNVVFKTRGIQKDVGRLAPVSKWLRSLW